MLPPIDGRIVLSTIVAASLVASNVAASKIASLPTFVFGNVTMPAGFVGIAVAFLATDLLSERYGKEDARSAVNASILSLAVAWGIVYSAILLPAAPFYGLTSAFSTIMGQSMSIVAASVVTLLVSQNMDVSVFHAIKDRVRYKFARNIGSTAISQAIDTTLFIALGFVIFPYVSGGTPMTINQALGLVVGQYLVKMVLVAADTPLFYLLSD